MNTLILTTLVNTSKIIKVKQELSMLIRDRSLVRARNLDTNTRCKQLI